MLLSVHIPKTAGVSFRKILAQLYGPGFVLHYWEMTDAFGNVVAEVPPDTTCIHGHFAADVHAHRFPEAQLITWVRNPVERVASSYFHRLRDPDWRHPVSRELHEKKLSIVEYARLELVRDEMARYFGTKKPGDFAFIGLVEDIDASMAQFFECFDLPPVPIPRENINPLRRKCLYELSETERREILELNQKDMEIYRTCIDYTGLEGVG